MIQARLVNERSLLLPDEPMFHKKKMKIVTIILIIIIVTIITLIIIIILIMIWGIMGRFFLMMKVIAFQTLKAMPPKVKWS